MTEARLNKLAALTRGAAVIGIGLVGAACTKNGDDNPPPRIMVNAISAPSDAAADNDASATDPAATAADASTASIPVRRIPIPNAMPGRMRNPDGGEPIPRP